MKKNQMVYLHYILNAIERVFAFTASDVWDEKTRYAVERALTIIGEEGNKISDVVKSQYPDIAWNEIR